MKYYSERMLKSGVGQLCDAWQASANYRGYQEERDEKPYSGVCAVLITLLCRDVTYNQNEMMLTRGARTQNSSIVILHT